MADDRFVSDEKRQRLAIVLKQLGMRQQDLAQAMGVSPAAISRFLTIGPDRIDLRPENLKRFIETLEDRLAECRAIKVSKSDEVEARKNRGSTEREKERSRALVHAALALSLETIKTIEADIAGLLTGSPDSAAASGPVFATPGGALGVRVTNYVQRQADKEIDGILKDGSAPASVVIGPVQGGTSSFLQRVYQRADAMRGCWAGIVHFEAAFARGEPFTQLDLFKYLFQEIGVPREDFSGDSVDVHGMKEAFDKWAAAAWRDAARVVVVIDGLDEIIRNAAAITDPLALINWFQALRNRANDRAAPYDRLALFVALTGTTWSAAHASPYATQAGPLDLRKFTQQEVADAFKQLNVDIDEKGTDEVYRLFHGHPYLTELFAWSMRGGASLQSTKEAALNLASRYESHWERLKSEIKFLTGPNFTTERVLSAVVKAVKRGQLDETDDIIMRNYRRGLQVFGLLDEPPSQICEFYWAAINRELQ